MVHRKLNGILPNWMASYQNEWVTFKLNGDLPKWMDHIWMAHSELNSGLRLRSLGSTNIPRKTGSADEVSSSWRTSCSYNLETHCLMCRGSCNVLVRWIVWAYSISAGTICRYVLVLKRTNPYLNDLFVSIKKFRHATCENILHSSGYDTPVHLSWGETTLSWGKPTSSWGETTVI